MNCKTLFSSSLFVALVFFVSQSEGQSVKKINFGLKASPNLTYSGQTNSTEENPPSFGYEIGISGLINVSQSVFLASEVSLSADRSARKTSGLSPNNEIFQKNKWIKMPVSFNFIINPASKKKFFIGAGPSFKRLISGTYIYTDNSGTHKLSVYDYMNHTVIFGLGQLGLNWDLPEKKKCLISISVERSLSNLFPSDSPPPSNYEYYSANFILNTISVNFNYFFY